MPIYNLLGDDSYKFDHFYDRKGQPITLGRYAELKRDPSYYRVALCDDTINGEAVRVSTVWLGINHSFSEAGPPLIFETMVFGGKLDGEQERYSTQAEATEGHRRMVERVRQTRGKWRRKMPRILK